MNKNLVSISVTPVVAGLYRWRVTVYEPPLGGENGYLSTEISKMEGICFGHDKALERADAAAVGVAGRAS